jgi:hypothetical protein
MNWFKKQLAIVASKTIEIKVCKPVVKLAYTFKEHDTQFARQDFNDGYSCKVQLSENKHQVILTARFLSNIRSMPLYTEMWAYGLEEKGRALKTFNRIVNVVEDLKLDEEDSESVGPTLQGSAREQLRYIDIERKRQTNNRSLEAAKYLDGGVTDWRESIYGNRYPSITINNSGVVNFNDGHGRQT